MTFDILWRTLVTLIITIGPIWLLTTLTWKSLVILLGLCMFSFGIAPIAVCGVWLFAIIALWDPVIDT